jgi:hypothetical protein
MINACKRKEKSDQISEDSDNHIDSEEIWKILRLLQLFAEGHYGALQVSFR